MDYAIVSAWKDGAQPGCYEWWCYTYGIRIKRKDRDRLFDPSWKYVVIIVEDKVRITVKITDSFWRSCSELRHQFFKEYFLKKNYIPWPRGKPPKFLFQRIKDNVFRLAPLSST